MADTAYSRNSFRPIRKDITIADLEAALPRLYCSSFMNRRGSLIDPADSRFTESAWNVKISLVHEHIGFRGLDDYLEIRVAREYTNYTLVIRSFATLSGYFMNLDMRFEMIYKNGYTEATYKEYIEQKVDPEMYHNLRELYYVEMMNGVSDSVWDWIDSISIVRYEPRQVS